MATKLSEIVARAETENGTKFLYSSEDGKWLVRYHKYKGCTDEGTVSFGPISTWELKTLHPELFYKK